METTERTTIALKGMLALLLVLGVVGGLYWNKSRTMADRFNQEEQRADSLLSVKLQLEGDIRSLTSQLDMTTDENESLDKRIGNLHDQLHQRNVSAVRMSQQNRSRTHVIQGLNKTIVRLNTSQDSLEKQMEAMRDKIGWLSDSTALLANQNNELQQNIHELKATLSTPVPQAATVADAFMVESTKANKKLTAKAKKVNALTVSLTIPAALPLEGVQDVYLSLTDSQQNPVYDPLKTTTVSLTDINEVVPVHSVQRVNFDLNPKRITLSIKPDQTLKPGKYRASVYTKSAYLGSVEFQLRDSFWFF